MDYLKLQNGSDVRGIALPGIEGEEVNFTGEIVGNICRGFYAFLKKKTGKTPDQVRISIGTDSRLSGKVLKQAAMESLISLGCQVADLGLASTPAMFMSTITPGYAFDGAIMLTASHLPWNRNGMKFFTPLGGLEKKDVGELLELAQSGIKAETAQRGHISSISFMDVYANQLCSKIRKETGKEKPLQDLKIILDAGNGAGGFFAHQVLLPLGADISGSQFLNPDGHFPNHIPNPESQEAMDSIIQAVKKHKADLGIIFDTDVDRAALVDNEGNQINRNRLVALMSAIVLDEHPGSTIVTDSITSDGLSQFITQTLKGKHHRFKRGYKNVINEAIRLNQEGRESWLAIETSGHAAMKENYFLDDGAYLIAKVLVKMAKTRMAGEAFPGNMLKGLNEPAEDREIRFSILLPDFTTYAKKVLEDLPAFVSTIEGWDLVPENYEGIRVSCGPKAGDGWFLLRMSLHDPVMPLNVESNKPGGTNQILDLLQPFFERMDGLKTS
ncbi:MAG: phosphomannomutase/phosphoglucomutase [Bacteroidales bacterium]